MKKPLRDAFGLNWNLKVALTVSCFFAFNLFAAEIPLNSMGYQFYSKHMQVDWKPTNNVLPATVRIFNVVPTNFSTAVISYLMKLGNFAESNRVRSSNNGQPISPDVLAFAKNEGRAWLNIDPSRGSAFLSKPIYSIELPEGVPDKVRAYVLGTNVLKQLAISTNEVILDGAKPKAWCYEGTTSMHPKKKPGEQAPRAPITRRSRMGVEFRRQLDGIPCDSDCIHLDFESHERVTQVEVNWHGLQPSKPIPMASTAQMTAWIKEGRARVQSLEGPTDARWLLTEDIKRITIVEVALNYTSVRCFSPEKGEDEEMNRIYPYAVLKTDAELGPDDHETIWLFCPIISEDLNKPSQLSTKDPGFSIYPSDLREKQKFEEEVRQLESEGTIQNGLQ